MTVASLIDAIPKSESFTIRSRDEAPSPETKMFGASRSVRGSV